MLSILLVVGRCSRLLQTLYLYSSLWHLKTGRIVVDIDYIGLTRNEVATQGHVFLKITVNLNSDCVLGTLCRHRDVYGVTDELRG